MTQTVDSGVGLILLICAALIRLAEGPNEIQMLYGSDEVQSAANVLELG